MSTSPPEKGCQEESSTSPPNFLYGDQSIYRMADRSEGESEQEEVHGRSTESLFHEIKKLEKQKADLERRNSERQTLEKQLKELQKNVTSLKAASPNKRKSPVSRRTATGTEGTENCRNLGLGEARAGFRSLQRLLTSADQLPGSSRDGDGDSDDVTGSSEEDPNTKESASVMSADHKQRMLDKRSELVENLLPEDIFSDLIANKVLTTSEVNRIKEKKTREDINEELINTLLCRSDRAFYVFIKALRRTLQEHLAELIEDPPVPAKPRKKKKKKRNAGELEMRVNVEDVRTAARNSPLCSCAEVEEQILVMAKNAYRNIRRRDETPASFEQFRKELSSTNEVIRDSMEIMNTLKVLCKHGRSVNDLTLGSVRFVIQCTSVLGCRDLWMMYSSGRLLKLLHSGLVNQELKAMLQVSDVVLRVHISESEYSQCCQELGGESSRYTDEPCLRQQSTCRENRSRKCKSPSVTTLESCPSSCSEPRRVFRELPRNLPEILTTRLNQGRKDSTRKSSIVKGPAKKENTAVLCSQDVDRFSNPAHHLTAECENICQPVSLQRQASRKSRAARGCVYKLRPRNAVLHYN